jgi:hypothetical protein
MRSTLTEPSAEAPDQNAKSSQPAPSAEFRHDEDALQRVEPRNFVVLVIYQVAMRAGWIFKTESIIMPFVLDSLGGSAWLRGMLPLINRFGQSVPPMLAARRLKVMPQKKWAQVASTSLMALCFLALAVIWALADGVFTWMPWVFLAIYALFFVSTGINQLTLNTLQGKLVEATHRGRLMLVANLVGAIVAIGCVLFLLPGWLTVERVDYVSIFGFTGFCFAVSAASAVLLVERRDNYRQAAMRIDRVFGEALRTLREDANFRRLAIVAASFNTTLMLFPHYQALGRGAQLGLAATNLMWWVILQNAGTAMFSFVAGPLADRRGNRVVLQLLLLALCAAPPLALVVAGWGGELSYLFSLVFVLVGLTPVAVRILNNYALEVSEPADHPRYLSTLSLCMSAPILLSPLVGWSIEGLGFAPVFLVITAIVFGGWLLSFTLREPRNTLSSPPLADLLACEDEPTGELPTGGQDREPDKRDSS